MGFEVMKSNEKIPRLRLRNANLGMAPEVAEVVRAAGLDPATIKENLPAVELILDWRACYLTREVLIHALKRLRIVRKRMKDVPECKRDF